MRARIRASLVVLTAIALVSPAAIAAAQEQMEPAQPAEQTPEPAVSAEPAAPPPEAKLELSLDGAVERALENNVDIVVARYSPELSAQSVRSAAGYYDPSISSTYTHQSSDNPATSSLSGADVVNTKQDEWSLTAGVPFQLTGGNLSLSFTNNRRETNNLFSTFNPNYNSRLTLSLTQPLLRNFRIDSGRQSLRIAKKNREISDVQFHATIVNTVASVKSAYYDLIYAIDNLAAAQKSLNLAKRQLEENEIRVKVGTMAPLEVVQAQAEAASREAEVIRAENDLANYQDALKQAIFPENDAAMWATRIVPTDRPTAELMPVDANAAVRTALEKRTDVVAARKSLESSEISLRYARNQLLPDVSLTASYGTVGTGGTEIKRESPFGGDVLETIPGGYGDALSDVFGRDFPTWSIGAAVTYSIPNRSARAAAARAQISLDQARASLRRLELSVAAEVRSAARAVESGWKSVQSTRATRVLRVQQLDAEEKRFAAGMSTNYLVLQAQRDLARAEADELSAIAGYRKAIISFQRVQEAGLSGSGSTASYSSSTASFSGGSSAAASAAASSGSFSSAGSPGGF